MTTGSTLPVVINHLATAVAVSPEGPERSGGAAQRLDADKAVALPAAHRFRPLGERDLRPPPPHPARGRSLVDNQAGDAIPAALSKNSVRRQHQKALPHAEVGEVLTRVHGRTRRAPIGRWRSSS